MSAPQSNSDLLQFAEQHVVTWGNNASQINLTSAQVNTYKTLTDDARQKLEAAIAARNAAKQATVAQNNAFKALRTNNSALIRLIRGFAEDSADASRVLQLADLAPIAPPSPFVRPTAPFDLTANLAIAEGGIRITWKASQPAGVTGVVYRVERALGAQENWTIIGLTGTKNIIDATIPTGTSRVFYRVTAQRGTLTSTGSTVLDIRLGTGPGQAMTVSTIKIAA